jgi:hypothetical protein
MAMRFYVEALVGVLGAGLFLLTLVWNDWIEIAFKVDPDAGDGSLEKTICILLAAVVLASAWFAHTEWRRMRAAATSGAR